MKFLQYSQEDILAIEIGDDPVVSWSVDAAFGVHPDMKSHTGTTMTLGKGSIISTSSKQKINTRSSTEAELVAIDDAIYKILWTKRFLEAQGCNIQANVIYQDNQSSMKLETNRKHSSGKRTRHFSIKYFYVTDLINRGEITIEYCRMDEMTADYMTKPLTGVKFVGFRKAMMNLT